MLAEDPTEVNALTGLALIKINQSKDILIHHSNELVDASKLSQSQSVNQQINQLMEDAMKLLSQAYSHDPYHPMTLLLLADHYFNQACMSSNQSLNQSDLQAVKMLCERGLECVDQSFHSIRCEFYYQLGRVHQSINQSTEALHFYEQAKKESELCARDSETNQKQQVNSQSNHVSHTQSKCRHPLVLIGHAQMCIATDRWKDARSDLEFLKSIYTSTSPFDQTINRLLGGVYMHFALYDQAQPLFEQAINACPHDVELLVEYAMCCEQIGSMKSQAKDMYVRALQVIDELNQSNDSSPAIQPPAQIVHNLAVVCHDLGLYVEARQYYERAIQIVEDEVNQSTSQSLHSASTIHPATLTSRYNLAVLNHHVALSSHSSIDQVPSTEFQSIVDAYQSLIDAFPTYLDAHLRLGQLYLQFGRMTESLKCFDAVLSRSSRHLEARTLKAQWLCMTGALREAEREYNQICIMTASGNVRVVDPVDRIADEEEDEEAALKGDPYSKIALGNLYYGQGLILARAMQPTTSLIRLKLTKSMATSGDPLQPSYWSSRAAGYYRSVLNADPRAVYAAHGLGCILASQGEYAAAKDVFTSVREVANDCVEATINFAHTLACQQSYALAIKLYED
jgi:RNA polymerase-associated protein CTR9